MRVADRLAQRESTWRELDALLVRLDLRPLRDASAGEVLRLGELYRAACTDLMLAEAHDLPRDTVHYLHGLVGRAHNMVYRARGFRFADWGTALFGEIPRALRRDPALKISAAVFWGLFLLCMLLAAGRPEFAEQLVGEAVLDQVDEMYSKAPSEVVGRDDGQARHGTIAAGFYIQHNTTIGLQCYAWGILFGLGSLFQLVHNGMFLGTIFGHMATGPHAWNFTTFVTAHGPFELTGIVFAGAAGLRLGWGVIVAMVQWRIEPLRREAARSVQTAAAASVLFILAAFLEGFVSPSALPYAVKASIALFCAVLLGVYLVFGGREPSARSRRAPAGG